MSDRRWTRRAFAAAPLALWACATRQAEPELRPSSPHPLLGQPAPSLGGRTLDGVQLDAQARRQPVLVVEFFASYCKPCEQTLPAVERVHRAHGADALVVGVGLDEYRSASEAVARRHGLSFPVLHDAGGIRGRYRVSELPATFVVTRAGEVHWVRIGSEGGGLDAELRGAIASALRAGA